MCKKAMDTGKCGEKERAEAYPPAVRTGKLEENV